MGCRPRHCPPPRCYYPPYRPPKHGSDKAKHPPPPPSPPPPPELRECKVNVCIVDVHSWVTLSQKFYNPANKTAERIIYTFSMLADSAIYAFEMIRQNGTKVVGISEERNEARRKLNKAIAKGKTAALGEELSKDVFSIELGNIGPKETITINLSYISPLFDDEDNNQLRFTLPRTYMQRYGSAPSGKVKSSVGHEDVPVTINVFCQQAAGIEGLDVLSSGYEVAHIRNRQRPPTIDESHGPDANFSTMVLTRSKKSGPSKDLVLVVRAKDLGEPRAFVEMHPSPEFKTMAVALTFNLSFKPRESPLGMEFIALVDRSHSMGGVKLDTVKTAIKTILAGLPTKNSFINVVSFGDKVEALWPQSRPYDDPNVRIANRFLRNMKANLGGTDLPKALRFVFKSLPKKLARPVSIFLLTDGGTWDVKTCVDKVKQGIDARATKDKFIRVFTVGLGNGVSTEACDRISRAGGGTSVYIVSSKEPYLGKCQRLIDAARQVPIVDVKVDWFGGWQPKASIEIGDQVQSQHDGPIDLANDQYDRSAHKFGPRARIEQAPFHMPTIFPLTRGSFYVFLPKESIVGEHAIIITGKMPALNDQPISFTVPIKNLVYSDASAILHKITARALIREAEEGNMPYKGAELKENIIRLGTQYNLTSRYTSFLAIDDGKRTSSRAKIWNRPMSMPGFKHDKPLFGPSARLTRGFAVEPDGDDDDAIIDDDDDAVVDTDTDDDVVESDDEVIETDDDDETNGDAVVIVDDNDDTVVEDDDDDDEVANTHLEVFVLLAHYQGCNGGYGAKAAKVFNLLNDRGGATAKPIFTKYDLNDEVSATLLAWAWLSIFGSNVGQDVKDKADSWLRLNVQGLDVDAVQKELLDEIAFEDVAEE